MNLDALISFVQIAETGSFSLAAQRLSVTQSTISNRIQALENDLGCILFQRGRGGAALTAEGQKILADAQGMIGLWDATRRRVSLPSGIAARLSIGTPTTFDAGISTKLVTWLRRTRPDTALHVEAGSSAWLLDAVSSRSLDAAILFLPAHRPGIEIEELYQEDLVLTASTEMVGDWTGNLIEISWGDDFAREFSLAFPSFPAPKLSVGLGILGAQYLTALKGAAWLTRPQAQMLEAAGQARPVPDAPVFRRPVYLAQSQKSRQPELVEHALAGLRSLLRGEAPVSEPNGQR